ncbi:MAG TPA: glycosyltransferase family 1 protein [Humisphaera sp.]|jgi:glycosyltransferase involved in cell wall biosynthesis|nr:glycosyltransferase family 1 protein [Humisphaera sp.]
MRSKVAIDVTPLLYTSNGIGRCTRALVNQLLGSRTRMEFTLFGRRLAGRGLGRIGFAAPTVQLRLPRRAERLIQALGLVELTCKAELYHATDFYIPLKHPERAVATIHDVIFLRQPETMVDHARLAKWVPDFARRCRAIVTVSDYSKREIVDVLGVDPGKVHVTYPAVDAGCFKPEADQDALRNRLLRRLNLRRPYFLAVSCSQGRKNTPLLLEAYSQLIPDAPMNDLVLIWDAPAQVRERFSRRETSARIHFVGRQTDDELRDLYAGATALVFPSLYEGFGLPVLEALKCGTPVITSNVSSLPEVGGDAAIYVDPRDRDSIVAALEMFENESPLTHGLGAKGLRHAACFTWERFAQQTMDVYERCLEN